MQPKLRPELLAAACDFLRENEDGFEVVSECRVASAALQRLVATGMTMSDILDRVRYAEPRLQNKLVGELVALVGRRNEWPAFVEALMNMPREAAACLDPQNIGIILDQPMVVHLLLLHPERLDEDHPFFPYLLANRYWLERVSRFIALDDLERAASELRKALRGFASRQEREHLEEHHPRLAESVTPFRRAGRCLYVSRDIGKALVRELFDAMVRAGLVQPVIMTDCILRDRWAWESGAGATMKPGPLAGVELALLFAVRTHSAAHEDFDELEPEGAMILKIADFFRKRRAARVRTRHNAIAAAYAATHPAPPTAG